MAKIVYENLKEVSCQYCGCSIKPTGPNQKNCKSCLKKITNLDRQVSADMDRYKKFGTYDRIGQGGAQGSGKYSPFWRGEKILLSKSKNKIRSERVFCNRCGKNLLEASRWLWCIHHIDRDKTNQDPSNLELLCKRCHQLEHDCISHLEPVTTITYSQVAGSGEPCCENNTDDIV